MSRAARRDPSRARCLLRCIVSGFILWLPAMAARAQSTVVLYGLLDVGIRYVDHGAAGHRFSQGSSDQQGSRWGLRGSEDLGDGLRAMFQLESGVNLDSGSLAQGGLAFGRQSFVGLSSPWGSLTAGRQYDFMVALGAFHGVQQGTGTLDWNVGGNDRIAGQRLDNSLKYSWHRDALNLGALYSLAETSAAAPKPSGSSYLARYSGSAWSMTMAATLIHNDRVSPFPAFGIPSFLGEPAVAPSGAPVQRSVDRINVYGAGTSYALQRWTVMALYTETHYRDGDARASIRNRSVATRYDARNDLVLALSLSESRLDSASWRRAAVAADWILSRRTDLYLYAVAERAAGPGVRAVLFTQAPASGNTQRAVVAGIRHKF